MDMPWKQVTIMSQRQEFVTLALKEDANLTELCIGFEISRKTGYKWIKRFLEERDKGLQDRSRWRLICFPKNLLRIFPYQ
jgi:hypothetical protein